MTPESEKESFLESLDPGIRDVVAFLLEFHVETFESCQGGSGHAYLYPTVRCHGGRGAGTRALGLLLESELGKRLRSWGRIWVIVDGEPTGPYTEFTFWPAEDAP